MNKLYLLIFGILFTANIFAQGTITGFTIDPPAPTTADIVKVYAAIQFTSMSCDVDNQGHSTAGSTTTAYAHHCVGMLTAMCNTIDTFNLGMLPAGSHLFDMTLTSGSGGPPCTPGIIPDDQRNITFTVTLATGVANHNLLNNITIFPNPINTTATIQINELLKTVEQILDKENYFLILNMYSMGFSSLIVENLVKCSFSQEKNHECGELYLQDSFQKKLPLGVFYRFSSV